MDGKVLADWETKLPEPEANGSVAGSDVPSVLTIGEPEGKVLRIAEFLTEVIRFRNAQGLPRL